MQARVSKSCFLSHVHAERRLSLDPKVEGVHASPHAKLDLAFSRKNHPPAETFGPNFGLPNSFEVQPISPWRVLNVLWLFEQRFGWWMQCVFIDRASSAAAGLEFQVAMISGFDTHS